MVALPKISREMCTVVSEYVVRVPPFATEQVCSGAYGTRFDPAVMHACLPDRLCLAPPRYPGRALPVYFP